MKGKMYDSGITSKPGVVEAMGRNPNTHSEVNSAPKGPFSHCMGYKDDSGMHGDTSAKGKQGQTYNFK